MNGANATHDVMRAVVFDDYGCADVLHLANLPIPPVKRRDILLRIIAAGVNPADAKWRQGMFQSFAPLSFPHVPGYDVAGVVEAIGPDVNDVAVGDRMLAMLGQGAYAQYAVLQSGAAAHMPPTLDFATAAALPTAALTGVQLIEDHVWPVSGRRILITGAVGAVGRFALFAARENGAYVIAAVRSNQAEDALALGANEIVILGQETWSKPPVDTVVDTVGGAAVADLCRHLTPDGLICTVSTTPIPADELVTQPKFVIVRNDPARLAQIAVLVADGEIEIPISQRLPLIDAGKAQDLVEQGGTAGKIVIMLDE